MPPGPKGLAPCILAAGASRRLGEPKALVHFGERSVLEILVSSIGDLAREAPVLVITGAHHREIAQHVASAPWALDAKSLELRQNEAWSQGRTGSVTAAYRAREGYDLLLAPADVPIVREDTFVRLAEEWTRRSAPPMGWLAPKLASSERHGHPIVIGRQLAMSLSAQPPDEPLRTVRSLAEPLMSLTVTDPGILDDLDTRDDLIALRSAWASR